MDLGFSGAKGVGLRVESFRVWGGAFRVVVWGSGIWLGCRVQGLGFGVWGRGPLQRHGLGFRVSGLGFSAWASSNA